MIEQISIFDLLETKQTESRFTHECRHGSGYENGRVRIYCASCNLGVKELAEFLKEEYGGSYGHSTTFPDGVRGFADYRGNGMELWQFRSEWKERHSWQEMAKEIKRLIYSGEYLNEKEKAKVQEIAEHFGRLPVPHPRMAVIPA
jgi:hypothetical protein